MDSGKTSDPSPIVAPLSGEIMDIQWMNNEVFDRKHMGDGIAIKPSWSWENSKMAAPCSGTIAKIFETNHAFSMESDEGVKVYVHFGPDLEPRDGQGFKRVAEEGQKVKVGDTVLEFDLPFLKEFRNPP